MNTDKIYAESIAKEYAPKDKSKIVALRKLDAKAKLPAIVFTYSFGINAALVSLQRRLLLLTVACEVCRQTPVSEVIMGAMTFTSWAKQAIFTRSAWRSRVISKLPTSSRSRKSYTSSS